MAVNPLIKGEPDWHIKMNENMDALQEDVNQAFQALNTFADETNTELDEKADANVPTSLIIYVSPSGNDELGDGSEGNPYKTINYAIDTIPKAYGGYRMIEIKLSQGEYDEDVIIRGFTGPFKLIGASARDNAHLYRVKSIWVVYTNWVRMNGIEAFGDSGNQNNIIVDATTFAEINACNAVGAAGGIWFGDGAVGSISNSMISNCSQVAIAVSRSATVSCVGVTGTNNNIGLRAGNITSGTGGFIFKRSVNLGATVAEEKVANGQIFGG